VKRKNLLYRVYRHDKKPIYELNGIVNKFTVHKLVCELLKHPNLILDFTNVHYIDAYAISTLNSLPHTYEIWNLNNNLNTFKIDSLKDVIK